MHFIFFVIAALAFVLNVNAAAILGKRASPDVQSCIVDLNQVSTQLDTLESTMRNEDISHMKDQYLKFQEIAESVDKTCCSITQVISDADADEFLASLSHLPPTVEKIVATIDAKKKDYPEVPNFSIVLGMSGLEIASKEMFECFGRFTPASKNATLQEYFNSINSTLYTAADKYPI
ncbi:hypothetical protein BD560DRAFT_387487 [Blakeslea trispora]|nr:hypothetical protein BD560DRAFT_387487 [Blakeslea trispora]